MRETKKEMLEGIKNIISSKIIDRNIVKCILSTGENIIIFHNTIIISEKDGIYTLNSGGWRTSTTKDRINKYSPARINQHNSLWYLQGGYLFYDGVQVNSLGEIVSKKVVPDRIEKKNERMKERIRKYCLLITEKNLPIPSSGDCWLCSLRTEEGTPMGELNHNHGHLLDHLKEKYLHGSILVNAMREYGYRDEQLGLFYSMKIVNTFRRATRKYLQKRLLTFNNE